MLFRGPSEWPSGPYEARAVRVARATRAPAASHGLRDAPPRLWRGARVTVCVCWGWGGAGCGVLAAGVPQRDPQPRHLHRPGTRKRTRARLSHRHTIPYGAPGRTQGAAPSHLSRRAIYSLGGEVGGGATDSGAGGLLRC